MDIRGGDIQKTYGHRESQVSTIAV